MMTHRYGLPARGPAVAVSHAGRRRPPRDPVGELRLVVGSSGDRSVAVARRHRGVLQLLRPLYLDSSGQVCFMLVNPGGGCVGGDVYTIDLEVQRDARLLLTTQSATRVHRTPGTAVEQFTDIRLGPGSALEYVPDQLILYRGARYRQSSVIEMDPTASLVMSEIITPGWSPDGGRFRYELLRVRNEIRRGGELLAVDNLHVEPRPRDAGGAHRVDDSGFMEGHSHLGSLIAVDPRVDSALIDEIHAAVLCYDDRAVTGVSALNGPGFVLRSLADDTAVLQSMIDTVTALLRRRWWGQEPMNLRKY